MKGLLVWLVVVLVFAYSYFESFAYFSDSASVHMSLKAEQTSVKIILKNLTLIPCSGPHGIGVLKGIVVGTTGNSTLEGLYFKNNGWALKGVVVDNSSFASKNGFSVSMNLTLTPGSHDISLILNKTNSTDCTEVRQVMYLTLYVNGREYSLAVIPGWVSR